MTIGKLYFAMVDVGESFDEDVHNREDLKVFNFKMRHEEAGFAIADLEIINPQIGLLSSTRKQHIFISCEDTPGGSIVLLFAGRLIAYPSDLASSTITISYIAQPDDWFETQNAFLETLKVAPYYNEIFIPVENRAANDSVLDAYSGLLCWNRSTQEISLSDMVEGGSVIDLDKDFFFDSLQTSVGDPPVKNINLSIEVQWTQIGVGIADLGAAIAAEFTNASGPDNQINTLTPKSFESGWAGISIPTGYELSESRLYPVSNSLGLVAADLLSSNATVAGATYPTAQGATPASRTVKTARVWYKGILKLLGTYNQKRREVLSAVMVGITQNYSLSANVTETISLRTEDPVAAVNGALLDPSKPSFFYDVDTDDLTDYGRDALEYGLLRARARLIKTARAIETSFECPLESNVLGLSMDHTVHLRDDRLPNAHLRGKVISYLFEVDGDTGRQNCSITIASTIGTGTDTAGSGTTLAEQEYVTEVAHGTMISSLIYDPGTISVDQPIDVAQMESDESYLIDDVTVTNPGQSQNTGFAASSTPDVYLEANRTRVVVDLKTMNPSSELLNEIEIILADFTLPMHINLGDTFSAGYFLLEDGSHLLSEDDTTLILE